MSTTYIKIPFREDMEEAIISIDKDWTTRSKKYGKPGDFFFVKDRRVRLLGHMRLPLWVVAKYGYRHEGVNSEEEFIELWKEIHPRKGWTPNELRWTHVFQVESWPAGDME
jgi:hypothetical protein